MKASFFKARICPQSNIFHVKKCNGKFVLLSVQQLSPPFCSVVSTLCAEEGVARAASVSVPSYCKTNEENRTRYEFLKPVCIKMLLCSAPDFFPSPPFVHQRNETSALAARVAVVHPEAARLWSKAPAVPLTP